MEACVSQIEPDVWEKLDEVGPIGDRLAARLGMPEITERLQCALDSNHHRHLLIALSALEEGLNDTQTRGISVVTRDLVTQGHEATRYLDIECQDAAGYAALDIIGGELAEKLAQDDLPPNEIVERVLAKWRRFWGEVPKTLLSREQLSGLFAELWFLIFWLLPKVGAEHAVERWRGPFGARHDFEWQGKSIEVKAASSTRGRIHHINGIEQLAAPENGELLLFSLAVREEAGAAQTLPGVIDRCRSLFESKPEVLSRFEIGLARIGYSPAHDDEYAKTPLRVVEGALFAVRDDFPRVTEMEFAAGIPVGVEAFHYEINLNAFDHLRVAKSPEDAFPFL
jgi:hypothetical protein